MRWQGRRGGAAARAPTWEVDLPRVAGLLRAGLDPDRAWAAAGVRPPPAEATDPLERGIVAASELARVSGAAPATLYLALGRAAADRADAAVAREAALAGPRLSARILGWLPLSGLALAGAIEPAAWRLLATTPPGWALAAIAAVLWLGGRAWTARIVARAGRGAPDVSIVLVATALLRGALTAGADVAGSLIAVGRALGDDAPVAVGVALRSGAPPGWGRAGSAWGGVPDFWRDVALALEAAWAAGAAPGPALEAAGEALARRARRAETVAAAELGVRVAAPLSLCLLPAFVAVGVVPLVLASAGAVL